MRYSSAGGRWVIAATVLGSGMASIDATVVGIALPSIGRQFHASLGGLEWVVTGYLLTLAAWLLIGGALGDRYGRRRVFTVGVAWFTLSSAACAVAPGTTALIVTRALQGAGAALLTPGSLAIIESTFEGEDRGRAIGAWSGLGGVATAAGPLLGGYLVAASSWRWIFVINVPLGALVLWLSARRVPESSDPAAPARLDWGGGLLAVLGLAGVTYGLIEGTAQGWASAPILAALAGGVAALVAFVVVEGRSPAPMLPLALFRVRRFSVTNLATFLIYGGLGGVLFLLPVELQVVDGYTPLESGAALLPLTVVMLLLSARSGRLAARIGPRLQMSIGPVVVGLGLALLARSTADATYGTGVLPAVLVFGLGLAATVAPLTATALGALPDEQAGLASAVNNDVARAGGLVAVAVLPAIAGITGGAYLHAAELAPGFRTAVLVAGAWCAAAGLLAAIGLRPSHHPVGGPAEPPATGRHHCALDAPPMAATP
ncbi:MAG: MFS transporter [Acidimicrobiales bacterium]